MEQRIKVVEQGEELTVEIKAFKDDGKHAFLRAWMVMWSLAGLAVIGFLLTTQFTKQEYVFLAIYMAFWCYFEYKIVYVYRWRTHGVEKITVRPGEIEMTRLIKGRGIPQVFLAEEIIDFQKYEETSKAGKVFGDSYWVVSNPAMVFDHRGRTVSLGMELGEKDASRLFGKIKKFLKG